MSVLIKATITISFTFEAETPEAGHEKAQAIVDAEQAGWDSNPHDLPEGWEHEIELEVTR